MAVINKLILLWISLGSCLEPWIGRYIGVTAYAIHLPRVKHSSPMCMPKFPPHPFDRCQTFPLFVTRYLACIPSCECLVQIITLVRP